MTIPITIIEIRANQPHPRVGLFGGIMVPYSTSVKVRDNRLRKITTYDCISEYFNERPLDAGKQSFRAQEHHHAIAPCRGAASQGTCRNEAVTHSCVTSEKTREETPDAP